MASNESEDLSQLDKLDGTTILEALQHRYSKDQIYTNCGEILIAVNPYKKLPIFDSDTHNRYDWKKFEASAPPHIFNVAARAYQRMRETQTNQVILVSGESGAGKTESTKLMVKHFVHMCPHDSGDLHEKVVKVNPLLEAFGNAQTIMNENSSRFAKFLEISFEENGQVVGAVVRDYMLEKSRVVHYSKDEGNFHIFYSLFAGSSSEQLSELGLKEAQDYKIMKYGSPELLKKTDHYRQMYKEQMSVLRQIGFSEQDISILHGMLGAVIHLSEIKFKEAEKQNEPLEIVNGDHVKTAARLLNVDPMELCVALIKTKTDYGALHKSGEQIHCLKSLEQANDGRDALAKAIYERLFGWLIRSINEDLNPSKQRGKVSAVIGILDIAGFENLHENSFEQLCINFVNERLQNFMNDSVFKTEKAIYQEEGIQHDDVDFSNNLEIIHVFTKKTVGLLDLLDEETKLGQGSDLNFVQKVTMNHSGTDIVVKITTNDPEFGIKHFAGKVIYRCNGFLEKNKDTLNDDLFDCMKDSQNPFIQDLFTVAKGPTGTISETHFNLRRSTRVGDVAESRRRPLSEEAKKLSKELGRTMKKRYSGIQAAMATSFSTKKHNTVLSYFRASMDKLLEKMRQAEAHFVRCIKPNSKKQKENFDSSRIKEQLLYNGILEIAKIRKMGFPVRRSHMEFYKRYSVLHPGFSRKKVDNPAQSAHTLLDKILPANFSKSYKIGKHRVFLKEPVHLFLEKCLYIRENSARRSLGEGIWKFMQERKAKKEEKDRQLREDAFRLQQELEHNKKEKEKHEREQEEREKREREESWKNRTTLGTSIGSTTSTAIGSTIGSTISSTRGSSSSDTSSSGHVPFSSLSRTKIPGGGTKPIASPAYLDDGDEKPSIDNETIPKIIYSKKPAPQPPTRNPPSRESVKKSQENMKPENEEPPSEKKESKKFWDIFANIPREMKTQDVHERGSLRFIKVITYGFLFLLLLVSLVFQKISLMLLVNRQNRTYSDNAFKQYWPKLKMEANEDYFNKNEAHFNSARYLLLLVAVCIPYILTVLSSILKVLFGNLRAPKKSTFIVSLFMEGAHSVGLSYLVFKYLGEMHAARGIMVMSATCILPSILKPFFTKDDNRPTGRGVCKFFQKVGLFIADMLAIVAQISVIPIVLNIDYIDHGHGWETVLEIIFCFLLCSFTRWENFIDDRAFGSNKGFLQQFILQIKFDLQEGRPYVTMVTSILKIGISILMAYVLREELDLNIAEAATALNKFNSVKGYSSVICITVGSYVAYYTAYTICKLRMQIISFSVTALLSTPVSVIVAMLECSESYTVLSPFTEEKLYCYASEQAYNEGHWYHFLIGFLWLISMYWIARHIWFPNQERLAKVDRLFVNPLYCSMLLEQHLVMNRKRHNKKIKVDYIEDKIPVYRMSSDETRHSRGKDRSNLKKIPPMIYACATMWHENRLEMVQLLKSLYRVDLDQFIRKQAVNIAKEQNESVDPEDFEYYEFQAHILFDDAFEFDDEEDRIPNKFVTLFMEVMQEAANAIHRKNIKLTPPFKIPSPYGAQLVFEMPGDNMMYVHLKDKNKIRHRKRWSQVMYMYYLLGYRIIRECQERVLTALEENRINDLATWAEKIEDNRGRVGKSQIFNCLDEEVVYRAENTFILALDGDVDFTPKAVRLLVDRMLKNEELGAACGRIHPIGKGPMVWYQKFEYAVAHWLQKATEHVLGCVLCSPGCFSLFRGSALMDDNIMKKYTIVPTEASHHLMYDQGEDRWLCTLLLQQGYRVDYAAASDAYTYAPEGFAEFFNQRRRWMPSTMANIMDLLADAKNTVSINNNISWLYMIYQGALMVSTLIGPATVIMMIAGAYLTVFNLDLLTSYAIALAPAVIYTILCFTVRSKYQILTAEIFSALYSFIMMVVFVGTIITAVQESPFHPSVIFLVSMVFIFLFAAILHPWEFSCIIYGALYFLCVPSGFLLLVIYSLCNMNVISWGTREVPKKKTKKEIEEEEKKKKEKEEKKKQGWFSRFMPKIQLQDLKGLLDITKKEDKSLQQLEKINTNIEMMFSTLKSQSQPSEDLTEVLVDSSKAKKPKKSVSFAASLKKGLDEEDGDQYEKRSEEEEYMYQKEKKKRNDLKNPKWLEQPEFKIGCVVEMKEEETTFWQDFIEKYLKPFDANKEEQKKVAKELAELRNNVTAGFAFINLIWIAINFMFQLRKPATITFPLSPQANSVVNNINNIKIDILGLMFVIFYLTILLIQFVGLLVHRWGTFMHLIAITEIPNPFVKTKENDDQTNNVQTAKDLIRVCENILGEPMPDYPSDDEDDSRKKEREEVLMEKINNIAMHGVAENLRDTRNVGIGRSLRDTRQLGSSNRASRLGESFADEGFRRAAMNILARSKRPVNSEAEPAFRPNVLRQRGNQQTEVNMEQGTRKFGNTEPAFSDILDKIEKRNLGSILGISRPRPGNLDRTYRQEDDEPVYDEIPAAGTLSRAFHKKIQKMSRTASRPNENNGAVRFDDNFQMRHLSGSRL